MESTALLKTQYKKLTEEYDSANNCEYFQSFK